jgi:hypothetical protein
VRSPGLSLSNPTRVEEYIRSVSAMAEKILQNADLGIDLRELYEAKFSWPVISKGMPAPLSP